MPKYLKLVNIYGTLFVFPTSVGHGTISERETAAGTGRFARGPTQSLSSWDAVSPTLVKLIAKSWSLSGKADPRFHKGRLCPVQRMSLPLRWTRKTGQVAK